VVAAHPLAAQAGERVLNAGGSAVDAAIAAQMVLTLVEPQSSGIGGGAFMLHSDGRSVQAYDGRETAPAAATERLFLDAQGKPLPFADAVVGGRSVGTPGLVAMLGLAHQQQGRLPWARLLQPAIDLAEQGFAVSPRLHTLLAQEPHLRKDPVAAAYFYDPQGQPWPVGHRLRNPALADTLRALAASGPQGFYRGATAQAMVAKVQGHPTNPGTLAMTDLAAYRPQVREALCQGLDTPSGPRRLCGFPPPSSGGIAVAQILGLLRHSGGLGTVGAGNSPPLYDSAWLHRYTEASRLAYADRALYVGDPDFVPAPAGRWDSLTDNVYLAQRARLIGDKAMPQAPAGQPGTTPVAWAPMPDQPERGTSHISVIDAQGRAVSMTTTIEDAFGARQMVGGFLLNNQLTDFAFSPTDSAGRPVANRVQAGKRPRSSMAPTLVLDPAQSRVLMATGSPGGALIIHYTTKALLAGLYWGLSPQEGADLPNVGSTGGPLVVEADRYPAAVQNALTDRGHTVRPGPMTSGVHTLQRVGNRWWGGADPRREGAVAGD
jgi:gamma-glutamyltranspeptidase/glutathione hydrolase